MAAQGTGYKLQDNRLLCGACAASWLQLCVAGYVPDSYV
jgi:hypothetical protein